MPLQSQTGIVLAACAAVGLACRASPQPSRQAPPASTVAASPVRSYSPRPDGAAQVASPTKCVPVADLTKAPRKVRDHKFELSEKTRGIRTHAGVLVYEVTISSSGTVTDVRLVKPTDTQEPWPMLADGWRKAILDWSYEPTLVDSNPVAVCMTVTIMIHVN